jgi:3-methyladenine DNA glycosylase/8-oxoguanine DNA glycosylase
VILTMMLDRALMYRGGAYLTPAEMDVLTEGWAPYRSLGVYYTWAIADGGTA